MDEPIKILDHGYLRFVEAWGCGDAGYKGPVSVETIRCTNHRCGASILDLHTVPQCRDGGRHSFENPEQYTDYECGIIEAARQSTQGSFRGWDDVKCDICGGYGEIQCGGIPSPSWRMCTDCNGKGYLPGDARLLATLYNSKPQHATPFEFSGMTVEVQAPILVYREWHRHRTQSYNEMSARYAPLPNQNYVPEWDNLRERGEAGERSRNKQEKGTHAWNEVDAKAWWLRLPGIYDMLEAEYQIALKAGVSKELARVLIPVGRYSRMRASTNLRNWLQFVTLRSDPAAQWEIRQYALVVERILRAKFPRTYDLFLKRREGGAK